MSCGCYHDLLLPHRAVGWSAVCDWAVPGRTHLLFILTFSIQFLKMVPQKQQNSLMMSIVICMRPWRVPDYESDTEMNR